VLEVFHHIVVIEMSSAKEKYLSVSRFACFDILSVVVKHIGLDFVACFDDL
jgi:hypothetical protein